MVPYILGVLGVMMVPGQLSGTCVQLEAGGGADAGQEPAVRPETDAE